MNIVFDMIIRLGNFTNRLAGRVYKLEAEVKDQGDGFAQDIEDLIEANEALTETVQEMKDSILRSMQKLEYIQEELAANQRRREELFSPTDYDQFIQSLR